MSNPDRVSNRRKSEVVYFVQAETLKLIKIGIAVNVHARFSALQTGSPDKLILLGVIRDADAKGLEGMLHHELRHDKVRGEWFRPAQTLLKIIEAHAVSAEQDQHDFMCAIGARLINKPLPPKTPLCAPLDSLKDSGRV